MRGTSESLLLVLHRCENLVLLANFSGAGPLLVPGPSCTFKKDPASQNMHPSQTLLSTCLASILSRTTVNKKNCLSYNSLGPENVQMFSSILAPCSFENLL